jgi:hypothetical protein
VLEGGGYIYLRHEFRGKVSLQKKKKEKKKNQMLIAV